MRRIEPRLHARRQFRGIVRRLRHRKNIEAEISARYAEYPIGKTYVLRRDFQKVRSELRAFADDGVSRLVERATKSANSGLMQCGKLAFSRLPCLRVGGTTVEL